MLGCSKDKLLEINDRGVCDGLSEPMDQLNDALIEDGGPKSLVAGDSVISGFDAACQ